jgi:uncharacterized membrane protein YgcG
MQEFALQAGEDPPTAARRFGKALHDAWGVGSAACNNGVLLLVSVANRQVYISTGEASREA